MMISEQIKILCVKANISMAELARRLNMSPQSLSGKMKRNSFTVADLIEIAEVVGANFEYNFVLNNGDKI